MKSAAIIGCGYIAGIADLKPGRRHIYTHAKAIREVDGINLVASCDRDEERVLEFCKVWGVPRSYTDIGTMLTQEDINILIVATPTHLHYEHVSLGISRKVNAIFCEKPLAHDFEMGIEMIRKAEEANILFCVNYMRRWDKFYQECKQVLDSGELGRIETIVAYVDTALYMNSSHMLDMIIYFGGDVENCVGYIDRLNQPRIVHGEKDYGATAFIKHKNGILTFVKASGESRQNHYFEIDIQCTKGRLRILDDDKKYKIYKFTSIPHKNWLSELSLDRTVYNEYKHERMIDAYRNIFNAMEKGETLRSSGYNALKSLEIIDMIYKSDQNENKAVCSRIGGKS